MIRLLKILFFVYLVISGYNIVYANIDGAVLEEQQCDSYELFEGGIKDSVSVFKVLTVSEVNLFQKQLLQSGFVDSTEEIILKLGNYYLEQNKYDSLIDDQYSQYNDISVEQQYSLFGEVVLNNGFYYYKRNRYNQSRDFLDILIENRTRFDKKIVVRAYNIKGSVYYELGDYKNALVHFLQAKEIAEKESCKEVLAQVNINMAAVYMRLANYERTRKYLLKAAQLKKSLNDSLGLVKVYNNLGGVLFKLGETVHAQEYFQKSLKILEGNKSRVLSAAIYVNLGVISFSSGYFYLAIDYYHKALAGCNSKDSSVVLNNLAEVCMSLDSVSQAKYYFIEGIHQAQRVQNLRSETNLLHNYSNYCYGQGDETSALLALQKYVVLKDSLINEEKLNTIERLQTKHDYEKKQTQILLLEKDKEILHARLIRKNYYLLSLLGLFGVIILLLMLLFRRNRLIRGKVAIIQSQQKTLFERERELFNLHQSRLEVELESKQRQLASYVIQVSEKREAIFSVLNQLKDLYLYLRKEDQLRLKKIIQEISCDKHDDLWGEFDIRFNEIQQGFYERITERYPDITPAEKRLCAFLRMNMTTKEVALITHQNPRSIDTARTRLRKKLNLSNTNINLLTFLSEI